MTAKRGLDSICTTDTNVRHVLRPELSPGHKVARHLALSGHQVSRTEFHDPRKPYCDDPVLVGHRSRRMVGLLPVEASAWRPCRRCPKCLQFRQMRWRERAMNEIAQSKRSWFITLTFSPVHLAGILLAAKSADVTAVDAAAYAHVQRYFKRLRKNQPLLRFRYLAVYERGEETGRSHYHVLLHETGTRPVTKRSLEEAWPSNVHARLVDGTAGGAAGYITKYTTKSIDIRPRASSYYGNHRNISLQRGYHLSNITSEFDALVLFPLEKNKSDFVDMTKGIPNGGKAPDILALQCGGDWHYATPDFDYRSRYSSAC